MMWMMWRMLARRAMRCWSETVGQGCGAVVRAALVSRCGTLCLLSSSSGGCTLLRLSVGYTLGEARRGERRETSRAAAHPPSDMSGRFHGNVDVHTRCDRAIVHAVVAAAELADRIMATVGDVDVSEMGEDERGGVRGPRGGGGRAGGPSPQSTHPWLVRSTANIWKGDNQRLTNGLDCSLFLLTIPSTKSSSSPQPRHRLN